MTAKTIAVVAMGDMGHAVARVLKEHGHEVITCLAERSDTSRRMAERAGARDVKDLVTLVTEADVFLSILPPAAALDLAQDAAVAMKSVGTALTYVDCNAVSPETVREIAGVIDDAGAPFIDAGIVGNAPGKATPRFYVSGPDTAAMEDLDGCGFLVKLCGSAPGEASAVKMCYAALTKGTFTLHTALLMAAKSLGVYETVLEEFQYSQCSTLSKMENSVPFIPADAGRWIGEMEEIATTFCEAGVTRSFHDGAASVLRVLAETPFADETRETMDHTRTLDAALTEYVKHLAAGQTDRGDG